MLLFLPLPAAGATSRSAGRLWPPSSGSRAVRRLARPLVRVFAGLPFPPSGACPRRSPSPWGSPPWSPGAFSLATIGAMPWSRQAAPGSVVLVGWLALRGPRWTPPAGLRISSRRGGRERARSSRVPEAPSLSTRGRPRRASDGSSTHGALVARWFVLIPSAARTTSVLAAEVVARSASRRCSTRSCPRRRPTTTRSPLRPGSVRADRDGAGGRRYPLGALPAPGPWPDGPGQPGEDPTGVRSSCSPPYGRTDVLLTADAESDVIRPPAAPGGRGPEGRAPRDPPIRAWRTRSACPPRVAVISVGRENDYGHPRPETLADLGPVTGLAVYRTDVDGRVVLESDGRSIVAGRPAERRWRPVFSVSGRGRRRAEAGVPERAVTGRRSTTRSSGSDAISSPSPSSACRHSSWGARRGRALQRGEPLRWQAPRPRPVPGRDFGRRAGFGRLEGGGAGKVAAYLPSRRRIRCSLSSPRR